MPIVRGVICEKCGVMMYWSGNVSKGDAAYLARQDGWTIGKQCLCQDCKRKRKEKSEVKRNEL